MLLEPPWVADSVFDVVWVIEVLDVSEASWPLIVVPFESEKLLVRELVAV